MCAFVYIHVCIYMHKRICVPVCAHTLLCMWRLEGKLGELVPYFYYVGCEDWIQVVSLGPQSLFSRSPPTAPGLTLGHLSCYVAGVFLPRPLPQCVFEVESHCVTQTALNLMIFLLQFPEPLNHRCVPK